MSRKVRNLHHHSTFFAGGEVAHADMVLVKTGEITENSLNSGHYCPTKDTEEQLDFCIFMSQVVLQGDDLASFMDCAPAHQRSRAFREFPKLKNYIIIPVPRQLISIQPQMQSAGKATSLLHQFAGEAAGFAMILAISGLVVLPIFAALDEVSDP